MISTIYGLFSGFFSRHLKQTYHTFDSRVTSFTTFVHDKEIFISDWSRTPRWSRWDSPTSWWVGKQSAVDSGLSGRERVSDACPRRVPCHRQALSPWCRSPIRRLCYRIRYQLRCLWWFLAPSRTASPCRYAVFRVRFSLSWKAQNRSISLRHPSLGRYCCHGCLCGSHCARASGLKPERKKKIYYLTLIIIVIHILIYEIAKLYRWQIFGRSNR